MTVGQVFEKLRERGEMALVPYLTGGFPTLAEFEQRLVEVSAAGADLIEVGIPFCDPIADGPTIQLSSQVALKAGARLEVLLERLARVRVPQPLVAMSYLNPLLAFGRERLLQGLRAAGVAGLIIPDLPVDEADEWAAAARAGGVSLVLMAAPTSPDERLARIGAASAGFIYAVSVAGTTGARSELPAALPAFLRRLRAATEKPVAVGFGISRPEQVRSLRGLADGVVVGSRLVDAIREGEDVGALVRALKSATRS